ncbi:cytochrome P450 [Flagelloscypha sp. PMI_526]|nr:cytochrome P450 [Flagelloscypha sp. PMI_526]
MHWSHVVGALIAHLVFNRYEPRSFKARLGLLFGIPISNSLRIHGREPLALFTSIGIHIACLVGSIIIYRRNPKHPLSAYPGPFLASVTGLWMAYQASGGKRHILMRTLHQKYGTHVRIGPNMLSIVDVDAVKRLLQDRQVPRSSGYWAIEPDSSPGHLVTCRSISAPNPLKIHAKKRATWRKGFSSAALEDYNISLDARLNQLVEKLRSKAESGSEVNLDEWLKFFMYGFCANIGARWDFMGDLVLGGGFSMMQDCEDKSGLRAILEGLFEAQTPLVYIPWVNNIMPYLAALDDRPANILQFAEKCIIGRSRRPLAVKDLFYFFAKEYEPVNMRPSKAAIVNDAALGIGAGADTTVLSLISLFFLLLSHPNKLRTLQKEIDSLDESESTNLSRLAQLPYLNACIDETLRLFPPLITQLSRTPSNGHGNIIGDHYVPDGTTVYVAPLLLGRDPRYFYPNTTAFWPERWLATERATNPEIIHNTQAFIPFSVGVTACLGKQLAYRELQLTTATLIRNFNMKLVLNEGCTAPPSIDEMLDDKMRDWALLSIVSCTSRFPILYLTGLNREASSFKARLGLLFGIPIVNAFRIHGFDVPTLLSAIGIHIILLIGSIILYRLNPLHPLAAYPGPFLASITNFWMVYQVLGGKRHLVLMKLHEKYGTHVRIGPNMLSIVDVDAIKKLFYDRKVPRSSAYKAMEPDYVPGHLITCRSVSAPDHLKVHAEKRAAWRKGFSSRALEDFHLSFRTRLTQLVKSLKDKSESRSEVDLDEWFKFFIWDFMGDIVLGGGFSMMQDGEDRSGFRAILEDSFQYAQLWLPCLCTDASLCGAQTPLVYMPYLNNIFPYFAAFSDKQKQILQFSEKCIIERSRRPLAIKDLFYFFAKEDEPEHLRPSKADIISDVFLGIGAGSDTTVLTLISLFFLLLSYPDKLQKLREEVDSLDEGESTNFSRLALLPYLNACIDESLRLFPPLLTQLSRTPSNGHGNDIADRYAPDGTTVYVPLLLLSRDPRYFYPHPDAFWPERWLAAERNKNPEIIHNTQAYAPFSVGVTSCLGKQLAYQELQLTTATLIRNFDMKLVPKKGSTGPPGLDEMLAEGMRDWGMLSILTGNLRVTLESRV